MDRDYAAAREHVKESKALYEKLTADDPASVPYREGRARVHCNDAILCRTTGRAREGIAPARTALGLWQQLAEQHPARAEYRESLASTYDTFAGLLLANGRVDEAAEAYAEAHRLEPIHAAALNGLAWILATSPDLRWRDPALAVAYAQMAVRAAPDVAIVWNTLGAAYYRAGDWKAARSALERSMALSKGGNAGDWLFLAMTCWQQRDKEETARWFDKAVEWMDENRSADTELQRFRAEAATLLERSERRSEHEGPGPPAEPEISPRSKGP
jgi:tetratricopeptide (TPR) repeat protein